MIRSSPFWVVVIQYETEFADVFPFDDEPSAREFFESRRDGWSEVYLFRVVDPIRSPNA